MSSVPFTRSMASSPGGVRSLFMWLRYCRLHTGEGQGQGAKMPRACGSCRLSALADAIQLCLGPDDQAVGIRRRCRETHLAKAVFRDLRVSVAGFEDER